MIIINMLLLLMLLIWLQRFVYRRYWNKNLTMQISFSASSAYEGERLTLSEVLTNRKLLPLPWLAAKFQISRNLVFDEQGHSVVSDAYYQNDVFAVSMYQRITRSQEFLCARRGYYRIQSMDLVSSNIFISDKLVAHLPCGAELTVFPRIISAPALDIYFRQLFGDIEVRRFTNPDPFAYRGIREYSMGDDFRSINFKATAKTGELMVNVNSSTASQELAILLNLEEYSAWSHDSVFEEAIRIAASVAELAIAEGLSVSLYSNACAAVTGLPVSELAGSGRAHLSTILEKLARIDLKPPRGDMSRILHGINDSSPYYLLVSSNCRGGIVDAHGDMLDRGMSVRWLIPALADDELMIKLSPSITRWEVKPHEHTTSFSEKAAG